MNLFDFLFLLTPLSINQSMLVSSTIYYAGRSGIFSPPFATLFTALEVGEAP